MLNLFKNRRSVHGYSPKQVTNNVISQIFEAARWTPSAHNAQPWRFIIIRDLATKRKLAEAMADRWNQDMKKNGVPRVNRENLTRASIEQFINAPILVIACLTMEDMDTYPDRRRQKIEHILAVQSVAAAIENMLLAVHAQGLGACWFCAPLFCQSEVRRVLGVPSSVDPQALITIGYAASEPEPPPRKPLGNMVYNNRWGE